MKLEEAQKILNEHNYIMEKEELNEDVLSILGDAFNLFAPGIGLIFMAKAFFRSIGSHFDTKKIKTIIKKCEENKEDYAQELVDLLNKKIIHRPINQLNNDELAEAIEKLLNSQCGYHSIHIDNDDITTQSYNDEGYGTIKNKIISKLDEVYKILFQLFYNLVKYNLTKDSKYEDYIYNCCEKLYYLTTKMGNLTRAMYLASKGTVSDKENTKMIKNYLDKKTFKNVVFDDEGNYKGKRIPYKNGLKSIKPGYSRSDSDYDE